MRTTIRINDRLLSEAKKLAAERGTTLTAVIEDSLRAAITQRGPQGRRSKFRFPTFKGGGLQPGVDLDDTSALLDLMEGPNGTP
ncbi:MAG: type II toxin-antitoxin system VapB family antitoxin [Terriglobia bacterium]